MAKGSFNVLFNPDKTEIEFERSLDNKELVPEDQQALVISVQDSLATVKLIYPRQSEQYEKTFMSLFHIAKIGVEGEGAQPELAVKALTQFKKEIVDRESGKIKNQYLKRLGVRAFQFALPALIIAIVLEIVHAKFGHIRFAGLEYAANIFLVWTGTMIGVWLSFAISRTTIGFEDLAIIEKDRLEPALRLIFTGLLALIFAFLFAKNAIELKLGSLSSHDLVNDSVTAFLIGTILGINEKIIGSSLTKKTASLFES